VKNDRVLLIDNNQGENIFTIKEFQKVIIQSERCGDNTAERKKLDIISTVINELKKIGLLWLRLCQTVLNSRGDKNG
jgi:hypothetical protein